MKILSTALVLLVAAEASLANVPPDLLHYQGVLRSASGKPLDGTFPMVFRFLEGPSGNEALVDRHEGPIAVTVTGGLFSVQLGGGVVSDGAGPGTYTALSQVFRDFPNVLLRVQINGETLAPDMRALAAPYAHNATYLNGVFESQFLRSDQNDTAVGKIFFAGDPSGPGVSQGSVFISPSTADPNETLLGVAVNSMERFKIDAEGEVTVSATGTYGVNAAGVTGGAYFHNTIGDGMAYLGRVTTGIQASGSAAGGEFHDADGSGYGYFGFDHRGVHAGGNEAGGALFDIDDSGFAYVGYGDLGISGKGNVAGGYFEDLDTGAYGYVGWGSTGVAGYGATQGGYFVDVDGSGWARVGYSTYKITGTGAVSFVQNHPLEPDRVIVYTAPEGDEVATYTRGTARLVRGEARVRLGETFALVTNADVGLTAQVTPRQAWADLYVASISPTELVVRTAGGTSDASFDYQVWGLRRGFEETSVVQEKEQDASIPSMADHVALYARRPELRRFNALERHRAMAAGVAASGTGQPDLDWPAASSAIDESEPRESEAAVAGRLDDRPVAGEPEHLPAPPVPRSEIHFVSEPVEAGDVVVVDRDDLHALRLGRAASDPGVVGVVSSDAGAELAGEAWIASYGIVLCKVDATYGPVQVGDLLATSPTPGHAMRVVDARPGTVLGKALEPLEVGQGHIRIVITLR
jgi:hypothetical protein